jgi:hypothetical protein
MQIDILTVTGASAEGTARTILAATAPGDTGLVESLEALITAVLRGRPHDAIDGEYVTSLPPFGGDLQDASLAVIYDGDRASGPLGGAAWRIHQAEPAILRALGVTAFLSDDTWGEHPPVVVPDPLP